MCTFVIDRSGDRDQDDKNTSSANNSTATNTIDIVAIHDCPSTSELLPPGFRFHPTDQELVWFYLWRRLQGKLNVSRSSLKLKDVIAELHLYKHDPWELLPAAALHGPQLQYYDTPDHQLERADHDRHAPAGRPIHESPMLADTVLSRVDHEDNQYMYDDCREGYYFHRIDRKYPRGKGTRANRATPSGYWKATGRDRPVSQSDFTHEYRAISGIDQKRVQNMQRYSGWKKTLVFYRGRAPNGDRTDWVMHEFYIIHNDDHVAAAAAAHNHDRDLAVTRQGSQTVNETMISSSDLVLCRVVEKRRSRQRNQALHHHPRLHLDMTTHQFLPLSSSLK